VLLSVVVCVGVGGSVCWSLWKWVLGVVCVGGDGDGVLVLMLAVRVGVVGGVCVCCWWCVLFVMVCWLGFLGDGARWYWWFS
jgi:hypothetical protein